ncbi:MAG: flagellar filament capping protein FliD [Deltaproteobacteria bacterium]|jgi:flagellar hook-associated protein 2|nr:flagellar filament capping protein FliD [Deltaproteobacteria bacterium]
MASTTGVISGSIKWTGLASGTDFASVVDKLVAIEQRTITRQENWKAEWQEKLTAITGLNTRLVSLKLDAESKDIRSELLSRSATVSNPEVLSVINTSTASLGSYDIVVGEKIEEKLASRTFNNADAVGGTSITITIGGTKSITLDGVSLGVGGTPAIGEYNVDGTIDDLADAINAAVADSGFNVDALNIKAEVLADKTRGSDTYERLVITSLDGGSANRITVVDGDGTAGSESNLFLGQNYIDEPVYGSFLGSDIVVGIDPTSTYTGAVNKSFTFMATGSGVLGTDDLEFQWADTEGHTGKITVLASDWQADNNKVYEVFQGLNITFGFGSSGGTGRVIANEAFSIDCQAPILQQGQDSGMAQTAKLVHQGFSDQISPLSDSGSSVFVYEYQGMEYSVNVAAQASLGILVDAINSDTNNPGVTASVVNDGQGTATSYHLVLTGNSTGADSTLVISSKTTLPNFAAENFSLARAASNAMVKVDGFPADASTWLQRRNNEVADVIDGCVFTLTGVGSSTVNVANDATAMRDKIVQLVESVNFCKTYILEYTKWGGSNLVTEMSETGEITTSRETANGIMIGNYGFQIAQSDLDKIMNSNIVPFSNDPSLTTKEKLEKRQQYFDDNGLVYNCLADIGITSDPDNQGLYTVEQSKLLECINKNPEAVIKLITFTDEYTDIGADGEPEQVYIRGMAQELAYQLNLITSEDDIYDDEGNMIQKGKGIMVTLSENYQSIIEGIDAKITREERRIEQVKARLTDKFNRLETSLQELESMQAQLESSIESLKSGSSSE